MIGALAVGLLAVSTGCGGSSSDDAGPATSGPATTHVAATDPATTTPLGDPAPAPLAWGSCGDGLKCATLTVPVDYGDASSGTVDLAVIRRPAADPGARIGPLVVNPGGPGGSGVNLVRNGWGVANGLGDRFDLVSWDPRGVGASTPIGCADGAAGFLALDRYPGSSDATTRLDQSARALADDCGAHAQPLLDHLDTATTIRDVDQLRRALGVDQISFAGYSYGTAIGLAYLEHYPEHLRALVVDGVVQPEWDLAGLLSAQTNGFDQSLDTTFSDCDAQVSCPVDHAAATYDRVATRLAIDPLPVEGGEFTRTDLAIAAISAAYDPDLAQQLLKGLAAADRGDASGLQVLVQRYENLVTSYPAYAGVECTDLPHPVGAEAYAAFAARLDQESPRFGAVIANELLPCAYWPAPSSGTPHPARAGVGGPTVLVVGTTGDPATPYASAQAVARQLGTAALLTDTGRGHTSGGRSACVDATVRRYLIDLTIPPSNALCTDSS